AGILRALAPPTPVLPDRDMEFPLHARAVLRDLCGKRTPTRIAHDPVSDVGRLSVQQGHDVSLEVPTGVIAREEEALGPGGVDPPPEDRSLGSANLPRATGLRDSDGLLHREGLVLESDRAVEPLRLHVLQTRRQDEAIRASLAGALLDEPQQTTSHALTAIRFRDEQVRKFGVRGQIE